MLGHGIPLWDPLGNVSDSRKKKHLKTGINIGDVGYINAYDGDFEYLFNMFSSATDDVQIKCPANFDPLSLPGPENIVKNETYFSPGTALVSNGVTVSRLSSSPL